MTKSDLVEAYVRGDVDRRGFIRKLTTMGVSAAAAAAYAGSLGQGAAASPSRNGAGFVSRFQEDDEDYGLAVAIENIEDAIEDFAARSEQIVDRLEDIANRGNGNGNGPKPELIRGIREQIVMQRQAVVERLRDKANERNSTSGTINSFRGTTANALQTGTQEEQLLAVAEELNIQVGVSAALIPAIKDPGERQLMTSIGLVTARHAALMSFFAGIDPAPSAFEVAIDPDEV